MSSPRLDRTVLVGGLVSGTFWVAVVAIAGLWPVALFAAAYVAVASVFLAAAYARPHLTRAQEAGAWAAAWLGAVVTAGAVLAPVAGGLATAYVGLVVGTIGFGAWQVLALAVRLLLASRAGAAPAGP